MFFYGKYTLLEKQQKSSPPEPPQRRTQSNFIKRAPRDDNPQVWLYLLPAQKPDSRRKRPSIKAAVCRVVRRADVVVHKCRILAIGYILRDSAQREGISAEGETEFQTGIKGEVRRKAVGICRSHDLLVLVHRR